MWPWATEENIIQHLQFSIGVIPISTKVRGVGKINCTLKNIKEYGEQKLIV